MSEGQKIYALNLFNIKNKEEYLAYVKRSAKEVPAHGGRVVAIGKYCETMKGDLSPRAVMILVEWDSREAFQNYVDDPALKDLHPHRENGAGDYIWQLFDRIEDFRPVLKG